MTIVNHAFAQGQNSLDHSYLVGDVFTVVNQAFDHGQNHNH